MIAGLKPYPTYKDSGVEWLGKVPEHWEVTAVKRHYTIQLGKMLQNGPNSPDDVEVPYLKAKHVQWFRVLTQDAPKMWASRNDTDQFGIALGDLLVCEGGEGGRCGILKQKVSGYIVQNALHRVRPREHSRNDFLQYVMSDVAATGWFDALNDKATIAHFTREKFGALRAPLPPLPEQTAITRFLDYTDRRIQRYIRAKQKLIALLEEQRQAIIHQAVTGQIDVRTGQPYPAYQDSGVEWLGEVPEHWEIRRLKSLVRRIDQGVSPQADNYLADGNSWGVLKAGCVNRGVFREREHKRLATDFVFDPTLAVKNGDVLVSRASGSPHLVGSVGRISALKYKLILSDKTFRPIFSQEVDPDFMVLAMNSRYYREQVHQAISGAEGLANNLPLSSLRAFFFAVPSADEQRDIVAYLQGLTNRLSVATTQAEREVSLLNEYRTRLISDVVTGKLDVREAAAKLPKVDPLETEADSADTLEPTTELAEEFEAIAEGASA